MNLNIWAGDGVGKTLFRELKEKGTVINFEYQLQTKSGKMITVVLSTATMELNGGGTAVIDEGYHRKEIGNRDGRLDRLNLVGEMVAGTATSETR